MLATSIPVKFPKAFGENVTAPYIRPIPTASQVGITPGAASLTDGFPPLTFQPIASGGVPPSGQDFNGILFMISKWIQWVNAGGQVTFDATFATAVNGYPKGALILADAGTFWYQSLIDNNLSNPNSGGVNWQQVVASAPATTTPLVNGAGAVGTSLNFARADHVHPTDTSRAALSYVNSTFETIGAANATFLPKANPITNGNLVVNGDLFVSRPATPTTGVMFMNAAADRYLYYDGTNYIFATAELYVKGAPVGQGILNAQSTATTGVSNAAAAQATANTALSNAATAQTSANNALNSALGSGQAYNDLTASRSFGTVFTNSTARPILVFLNYLSASGSHGLSANVNGALAGTMSATQNTSEAILVLIVPPGQTYQVNSVGFVSLVKWLELR